MKTQSILSNYHLKGLILKRVSEDIVSHLDGVNNGVIGEVHTDETVTVFNLFIDEKGSTISPLLRWADGKVTPVTSGGGRRASVSYVVPEGRSQGVFVDKNSRVFVPLRAERNPFFLNLPYIPNTRRRIILTKS